MEGNVTNILPSNVWSGYSVAYPASAADGITYIGTPDQLAVITSQEIKDVNVVIVRDLDMNNKAWVAKKVSNITVDGRGHAISNLKAENTLAAGLFGVAVSLKIKNLTLRDSEIKAVDDGKQNAFAGGFISTCYGSTVVENCVLDHCTVQGINKVAVSSVLTRKMA